MSRSISVGQLRQNPTRMLREVRAGATYTVTDHGEPIAAVVPRSGHRWVPSSEIGTLLRSLGANEAWAEEIAAGRVAEHALDPWEGAR